MRNARPVKAAAPPALRADHARYAARAIQGGLGAVALARLARGRDRRAPLAAGGTHPGSPTISVVIPARDEAHRLPNVLAPLTQGHCGLEEIIVVDDCSTDATAAVAAEHGARVVMGAEPPAGWIGKPWALQQGLEATRSEIVVFLDADVSPRRELPAAVAGLLDDADLASAQLAFTCPGLAQRILHPALLTTLLLRLGPLDVTGQLPPSTVAINGQCFAVRREQLLAEGGFELVAGVATDDVGLARRLRRDGWRIAVADGRRLGQVRMYESAAEAIREWAGRSLALPGVTPRRRQLFDLAVVWAVQGWPAIAAWRAAARAARTRTLRKPITSVHPVDSALLLLRLALVAAISGVYRRRQPAVGEPSRTVADPLASLAPLLDPLAAAALTRGTIAPVRRWRGRDI